MPLTFTDLKPFVHDPARMQQLMLSNINNFQINEATNPFTMLMEAAATLSNTAATEHAAALRFRYPSLAIDTNDVLAHVNTKQLPHLYSNPATTHMVFYLSVTDMQSNAFHNTVQNCYETVIPSGTTVTVSNTDFTLFNDIRIKLYPTGSVFAEQIISTDVAANNSLGILSSGIVTFQDQSAWIAVETVVKQLTRATVTRAVTASEGFVLEVLHNDTYHMSTAAYKNAATNGAWVDIAMSHSDIYIDPMSPTLAATPLTGMVRYNLPDVYLLSGQISGEILITLYTTKGQVDMPLHKYAMADYAVNLNLVTTDPVTASIGNITVYANSRDVVSGGTTGYTFQELKASIIHNTLGNVVAPVTTDQLTKTAAIDGFELYNVLDMVTSKVYVASKNIPDPNSSLIYAKPDVFFNTVAIDVTTAPTGAIITTPAYAIIPSNTRFKEVNGVTTILTNAESAALDALSTQGIINYLKTNNIFTNPYYYIMDTTTTSEISSRVYDLDSPVLNNLKIVGTNSGVVERVNIAQYGLVKTSLGYDLMVTLTMNAALTSTGTDLIAGQLTLPLFSGTDIISYTGVYDPQTNMLTFSIPTLFEITPNDRLVVSKDLGISNLTIREIDLTTRASIYIYTTDQGVIDSTQSKYLNNELVTLLTPAAVLSKEDIDVTFGRPVSNIWDRLYVTYPSNNFLKYTTTVPAVYQHDVYATDPVTGSIISVVTDAAGVKSTVKTLKYAAGTQMLDNAGNPMYIHRAGDVILDASGLPTLDTVSGVTRHIDIMMLEYEYTAANSLVQSNYLSAVKDTINGWVFNSVPNIANKTLENTRVVYRSYKQAEPVTCLVDSKQVVVPYRVKPTITIYTTKKTFTAAELATLKAKMGKVIHSYLDMPHISVTELKTALIALDSVIATVKITGLETYTDAEMFDIVNKMARLTIGKVVNTNANGELVVEYDMTILTHLV